MSTSTITSRVSEAAKVILGIPTMWGDTKTDAEKQGIAESYIWTRLNKLGIYDDADSVELLSSDDCTEGEARKVFCENGEPNLPVVRFKRVWSILKGKVTDDSILEKIRPSATPEDKKRGSDLTDAIAAMRPIDNLSDEELIAQYGPECPEKVVEELIRRSKGRAFVIFKDEEASIVDRPATLRMLREARKRETPVHYKSQDALKRLFKAGDWPNQVYEECPLHPHVLLLDGYCDECGHTWEGVGEGQRQFVRIAETMGETPSDGPGIRQLIATARQVGISGLENDYPKVAIKFRDLATEGKLPSLKSRKATSGKQDPFGKRF